MQMILMVRENSGERGERILKKSDKYMRWGVNV